MYCMICVTPKLHDVTVTCDIILTSNSKIKGKVKVKVQEKEK